MHVTTKLQSLADMRTKAQAIPTLMFGMGLRIGL